jgi:tetratricopeptide (TPR) repeat protein
MERVAETESTSDQIESTEDQIKRLYHDQPLAQKDEGEEVQNILFKLEDNLSLLYFRKFKETNEIECIEEALKHTRAALGKCKDAEIRQRLLTNQANALFLQYRNTHINVLLDEALSNFRTIIHLPFKDDAHKISMLLNFWVILKDRIGEEAVIDDVQDGIDALTEALGTENSYQHLGADTIRDLLALYLIKFDLVDGYPDLDKAITTAELATKVFPPEDPEWQIFMHNLATFLDQRFTLSKHPNDLKRSLRIWRHLVETGQRAGQQSQKVLNGLILALLNEFKSTSNLCHLDEAITTGKQAIEDVSTTDEALDALPMNLALCYAERFERLGLDDDIQQALHFGNQAVESATTQRDRLQYLNNLCTAYNSRYSAAGHPSDLDTVISIGRRLIDESEDDDHRRVGYFGNLSSWLQDRYDSTGALINLQEAIDLGRRSLVQDSLNPANRWILSNNLAERLSRWYTRTKDVESLEECIRLQREVVRDCGENESMRQIYMNNLGNYLSTKFEAEKNLEYLDEAISLGSRVLEATSSRNPSRASFLNNQGTHYHNRWTKSKVKSDLDKGISSIRAATDCVDPGRPTAGIFLRNLGMLLQDRHLHYGDGKDHEDAKVCFQNAFNHASGSIMERIQSGFLGGQLFVADREWKSAFQILEPSVYLLRKISPRSIARKDQQINLRGLTGLSSYACSVAFECGKPVAECLEILEAGRAIISSLSTNVNEDILKLEALKPDMFIRYKELQEMVFSAAQVNKTSYDDGRGMILSQSENEMTVQSQGSYNVLRTSFQYLEQLDNLEQEIRKTPGLRRFQLAPSADQCIQMAKPAPIAYFNVNSIRSDAILITEAGIKSIHLRDLVYADLKAQAQILMGKDRVTASNHQTSNIERNRALLNLLRWLWTVAVEPVLQALTPFLKIEGESSKLSRVFWAASGKMCMMPLHAAGIHDPGAVENTMSRVVSTYITTLKTFGYVRERDLTTRTLLEKPLLAVLMPTTPGMTPIAAVKEAESLRNVYISSGALAPEELSYPSKDEVQARLSQSTTAHFVCHGDSNSSNPSQGGLFLGREDSSTAEHLSIAELVAWKPQNAHLAYLSACSTAESLAEDLLDELIHTASSFQLLGFPHVVGTFWEAGNREAVKVAENFHRHLIESARGENQKSLGDVVAYSLHEAVQIVRKDGILKFRKRVDPRLNVLGWAPFVHFGA